MDALGKYEAIGLSDIGLHEAIAECNSSFLRVL